MSHNQPRYPLAVHAALAVGAAVTSINPVLTTGELIKQLAGKRPDHVGGNGGKSDRGR
ncbi:MAG: hypothetical protein ABIQ18_36790 [Umezawaea sp.]